MITLVGACLVAATASRAHAQDASAEGEASRSQELQFTVAAPADKSQTLVIKIVVEQPYIDHVATGVTYDGWDRVFGIKWKEGKRTRTISIPDAAVTEEEVFADILDRTNAGVSMPERFTPWTAPRLLPYLLAVREKWGRAFDDNGAASAQIATIALVATLRPTTTPLVASSARNAASSSARPRVASKPARPGARASTRSSTSSKSAATVATASAVKPSGVWSKPPAVRGREIEKALGGNLPDNFPVIDKFNVKSGVATSIKSLDLHAKAYQDARVVTSKVKGYIDKVAKFDGKKWGEVKIKSEQVKGRVLELAIPSEGTAAQKAALEQLKLDGHKAGVEVKIEVFP